jgi:hypothetical protein
MAHSMGVGIAQPSLPPRPHTVVFEPPVLVGQSIGVAVNASCGAGRFW